MAIHMLGNRRSKGKEMIEFVTTLLMAATLGFLMTVPSRITQNIVMKWTIWLLLAVPSYILMYMTCIKMGQGQPQSIGIVILAHLLYGTLYIAASVFTLGLK